MKLAHPIEEKELLLSKTYIISKIANVLYFWESTEKSWVELYLWTFCSQNISRIDRMKSEWKGKTEQKS